MKRISLILLFFSFNLFGLDFTPGTGSQFLMNMQGQSADLSIYVADKKSDSLNIEMHFGAGGFAQTNMWQQFKLKLNGNAPLVIESGYIQTKAVNKPEVMTDEFFKQNDNGVQVQDFLFSDKSAIEKNYIADEKIEIPAGTIIAKHYQKKRDDQIIDFWISESVGPISLVKLVSKSEKNKNNNYTIELVSLLKNVKASINPKEAIPLSKDTRQLLKKTK